MADTRVQVEAERWVRTVWLPKQFAQAFHQSQHALEPGGKFVFDGISEDGAMVVTVSTSCARTANGRRGAGKIQKIRADALFLQMSGAKRQLLVFTQRDMFELCVREQSNGRLPRSIECHLAELPSDLQIRLEAARLASSLEVSPQHAV